MKSCIQGLKYNKMYCIKALVLAITLLLLHRRRDEQLLRVIDQGLSQLYTQPLLGGLLNKQKCMILGNTLVSL